MSPHQDRRPDRLDQDPLGPALAAALARRRPPEGFAERVLARAAAARAGPRGSWSRRSGRRSWWGLMAASPGC
ncbi:MAG TPA: hypothetical protein VHQ65_02775, partial [Thermoanaerobaculia bacterium]|nr:hypothetical protein [Thermoanaerobaculia bacterium]